MTIKEQVEMWWALGTPLETAVVLAQERFPHKCASRTYVMGIYRNMEKNRCQSKD